MIEAPTSARFFALVPAAGIGARMAADRPKQYLPLHGRPVLLHTLQRLCDHPRIAGVWVGVSIDDPYWPELQFAHPHFRGAYVGGAQRALTVLNGLRAMQSHADADDWVLVHDAVRPCVRAEDIDCLMDAARTHVDGALLGLPMADTVKRANLAHEVVETVPREGLWRALTPQMFRLGALREALESAVRDGVTVTDEASAIERAGGRPLMVAGQADNIKITLPGDLALAALYLQQQEGQ